VLRPEGEGSGHLLVLVDPAARGELDRVLRETGVRARAVSGLPPGNGRRLLPVRLGLYRPHLPVMDEGWTRWVLEQYGFPYSRLTNEQIRAGGLRQQFDAILFASQSAASILRGNTGEWHRPEHRGGVGKDGVQALREFLRQGGTVIALDAACDFAIEQLELPVRNVLRGVRSQEFYCPGAILKLEVDTRSPLAFGMPAQASAYFLNSPAFELFPGSDAAEAHALARYPDGSPLQSGWIGGWERLRECAGAVDVKVGSGRVVLLGFRAQFRAQPDGTFKLLFNAIREANTAPPDRHAPRER
jgi:hypothetical protein